MFNGLNPALVQWKNPLGHAAVPGSSLPSGQSQKSSFTCKNGIVIVPSKQVKSWSGMYSDASKNIIFVIIRNDLTTIWVKWMYKTKKNIKFYLNLLDIDTPLGLLISDALFE